MQGGLSLRRFYVAKGFSEYHIITCQGWKGPQFPNIRSPEVQQDTVGKANQVGNRCDSSEACGPAVLSRR